MLLTANLHGTIILQFSTAAKSAPLIASRKRASRPDTPMLRIDSMKRAYLICLFQCLTTTFVSSQANPVRPINPSARVVSPISASQADPKAQARILDSYGKLPLSFEANHGQADGRVKFLSRTSGYSLFLTADEAVLTLLGTAKNPAPKGASHFAEDAPSLKRCPDTNQKIFCSKIFRRVRSRAFTESRADHRADDRKHDRWRVADEATQCECRGQDYRHG